MFTTARESRNIETSLRFSFEFLSKLLVIWIVGFISFFVLTFSSFNHLSNDDKVYLFHGAKKTVVYTIKKHVPIFKGTLSQVMWLHLFILRTFSNSEIKYQYE